MMMNFMRCMDSEPRADTSADRVSSDRQFSTASSLLLSSFLQLLLSFPHFLQLLLDSWTVTLTRHPKSLNMGGKALIRTLENFRIVITFSLMKSWVSEHSFIRQQSTKAHYTICTYSISIFKSHFFNLRLTQNINVTMCWCIFIKVTSDVLYIQITVQSPDLPIQIILVTWFLLLMSSTCSSSLTEKNYFKYLLATWWQHRLKTFLQ